jgi:uncharacterized Zn finger protein
MTCALCSSEDTRAFGGTDLYRCLDCGTIFEAEDVEGYAVANLRENRIRRTASRYEREDEY